MLQPRERAQRGGQRALDVRERQIEVRQVLARPDVVGNRATALFARDDRLQRADTSARAARPIQARDALLRDGLLERAHAAAERGPEEREL